MLYACVRVVVCRVLYAYVVLRPVHVLVCVMNNNMIHYTLVVAAVAATAGEGRDRRDRDGEEAIAAGRWPSVRAGARRRAVPATLARCSPPTSSVRGVRRGGAGRSSRGCAITVVCVLVDLAMYINCTNCFVL